MICVLLLLAVMAAIVLVLAAPIIKQAGKPCRDCGHPTMNGYLCRMCTARMLDKRP